MSDDQLSNLVSVSADQLHSAGRGAPPPPPHPPLGARSRPVVGLVHLFRGERCPSPACSPRCAPQSEEKSEERQIFEKEGHTGKRKA